jgi:protein required for attachment to host cells
MASRKYPRKQTQIGKKIKTYRKQGRHMQPQDNIWKEPSVMQPEEHSQQKQKTETNNARVNSDWLVN